MPETHKRRKSKRLIEQKAKRRKSIIQVPPALDIVFQFCNSPSLQFKLLTACFGHFLPLLCHHNRLTRGDKEILRRWLKDGTDFWNENFVSIVQKDAAFCIRLILEVNPLCYSIGWFNCAFISDAVNVFEYLDKNYFCILNFGYIDPYYNPYPTKVLRYLRQMNFDFSTVRDALNSHFFLSFKKDLLKKAPFDSSKSQLYQDLGFVLTADNLIDTFLKSYSTIDGEWTADQVAWLRPFLNPNLLEELERTFYTRMTVSTIIPEYAKYEMFCVAFGFQNNLFQKLQENIVLKIRLQFYRTNKNNLALFEPFEIPLLTEVQLIDLEYFLSEDINVVAKFHPDNQLAMLIFMLWNRTLQKSKQEVDQTITDLLLRDPEAVASRIVHTFDRFGGPQIIYSNLKKIDFPLENLNTPEMRQIWQTQQGALKDYVNTMWPRNDLSCRQQRQDFLVNWNLEFPNIRLSGTIYDYNRFVHRDSSHDFENRNLKLAKQVGPLYIWPILDF